MEGVHGVDISWLHHSNKDQHHRRTPSGNGTPNKSQRPQDAPNTSTPPKPSIRKVTPEGARLPPTSHSIPPYQSQARKDDNPAVSVSAASPITEASPRGQTAPRRPPLNGRSLSERSNEDGTRASSRRPSWINNISSKFSSPNTPTRASLTAQAPLKSPQLVNGQPESDPLAAHEETESTDPSMTHKSKDSGSFFSSLTRRLSSASQGSYTPKVYGSGTICPRKTLNIDPNRERCLVPELDVNKLRRVSFCVDVEIAGGPKYRDDVDDEQERKRKKKEAKLKERAEGDALKNPDAMKDEKVDKGEPDLESKSKSLHITGSQNGEKPQVDGESGSPDKDDDGQPGTSPRDSLDENSMSRKKEKKKRSEAERKERKELRLRRQQEMGAVPLEMGGDEDDEGRSSAFFNTPPPSIFPNQQSTAQQSAPGARPTSNAKPTTDPARIYRRCCQLRETPILKRITEQLMSHKCILPNEPGIVNCLDLTGSRMQLPDVVTLGDWLAVVPVKRLLLEDADLNDEGVRVIFAGLLAAKKPEPTKRRYTNPRHREGPGAAVSYQERSGVVEKVSLKNNPRITRAGWKRISLFLYMCRSIKALDLSMNAFPDTLPAAPISTPTKAANDGPTTAHRDVDAAEIIYKSLSERLGGSRLEELSISECSLKAVHIRKIVDGAIMCGISRLGLAGNNIDDDSLLHITRYLKSGVCQGIDLGGNDLRGQLSKIAESLSAKAGIPCWGLSLADCNLDAASLRPLLPALVSLPNFRFIDLSHNKDLCATTDPKCNSISLLRRYIGQMKELKRVHLNDVGMSPKQAIALAEVLPEAPRLAHVSILKNPQLTALANGTDEATQEEACALYASFLMAVRCSKTLICIDVDVPSQGSSEVVKALAKQVVAYSLRNMEYFAIAEATGDNNATATAAAKLTAPHGGEKGIKEVSYPDVLMHLVGHVDGIPENHDKDDPAPDDDYIVGGTGVVKALQYVLGEQANDMRRGSGDTTPGGTLPRERQGSSTGLQAPGKAKMKQMTRDLLDAARKIRMRLQPALMREASAGDEMAFRRLQYLDHTLESMIGRFEEEYPETRANGPGSADRSTPRKPIRRPSEGSRTEATVPNDLGMGDDEDDSAVHAAMTRHASDASLASRALTLEEGRLHRLGQHMRREVIASPSSPMIGPKKDESSISQMVKRERRRLLELADKIESTPGDVFRPMVEKEGWGAVLKKFGANYEDLRALQEQDPEAWEQFTDAQRKATMNVDRNRPGSPAHPGTK